MDPKEFLQKMHWRYATKQYDISRPVPEEFFNTLMEAARFAPSSYGLQPYKFVIVKNKELREKLHPHAFNQPQVTDASYFVVLCRLREFTQRHIDRFVQITAETRGKNVEDLAGFKKMMEGDLLVRTPEQLAAWMGKQTYLALGILLSACAASDIDASPMEGFVPDEFDEVLGLAEKDLHAEVLCAIGHRSPDDRYAQEKKVRFPKEEIFVVME